MKCLNICGRLFRYGIKYIYAHSLYVLAFFILLNGIFWLVSSVVFIQHFFSRLADHILSCRSHAERLVLHMEHAEGWGDQTELKGQGITIWSFRPSQVWMFSGGGCWQTSCLVYECLACSSKFVDKLQSFESNFPAFPFKGVLQPLIPCSEVFI